MENMSSASAYVNMLLVMKLNTLGDMIPTARGATLLHFSAQRMRPFVRFGAFFWDTPSVVKRARRFRVYEEAPGVHSVRRAACSQRIS
jgi:hypothetical protein